MKNLILIISMILCVSLGYSNSEPMKTLNLLNIEKESKDQVSPVVILDAGHGGVNPVTNSYVTNGKRSPKWEDDTIYYEGVGNRDIVLRASLLLKAKGIDTVFTVSPDDYVDVSLSKRVKIANKYYLKHNKEAILISVHSNGYKSSSAHGTEVFTSPGETQSDSIATIWMEEFSKLFPDIRQRTDFSDGDIDKEAKFTIIQKTYCPAILIETMFHTNKNECKKLMNPLIRERIALAICNTAERVVFQKLT